MDIWKFIPNTDNCYQVSTTGKIRRVFVVTDESGSVVDATYGEPMRPSLNSGYPRVKLRLPGGEKHLYVHRAVAEAFIPNPHNKSQVNHKDGNKQNSNVNNLEWCTPLENMHHASVTGLLRRKGRR